MHATKPEVYLIAQPQMLIDEAVDYLNAVGAYEYPNRLALYDVSDAADLVEFAGRICYRSWEPGLNKNVTKVRTDQAEYIKNLISQKHGSTLAHAQFSFVFRNVSRVFTEELSRHEVGAELTSALPVTGGRSQESLRYVRLDDLGFWFPDWLDPVDKQLVEQQLMACERIIEHWTHKYGLNDPRTPFAVKKRITSFMRRIVPMGISTDLLWSANLRTIRFVGEVRTSVHAEEEIRLVFREVMQIMADAVPPAFADFRENANGEWVTEYSKV